MKVSIYKKSLPMLGSILTCGDNCLSISMDTKKTEAISKTPVPPTVARIKSFLGDCARTHISSFSHISEPLIRLTWKNVPFLWMEKCDTAFQILKQKMVSAATSILFDPAFPILL